MPKFVSLLVALLAAGCTDITNQYNSTACNASDAGTAANSDTGTSQDDAGAKQTDAVAQTDTVSQSDTLVQQTDATVQADSGTPPAFCAGSVLRVPQDCTTIQLAVNAAGSVGTTYGQIAPLVTILVSPGTYNESVRVPDGTNIFIVGTVYSEPGNPGAIVINGGSQSAFTVGENTSLTLQMLTIRSQQENLNYGASATIFAEFSHYLDLQAVTIFTASTGVAVNYTDGTRVENSFVIADGEATTLGIGLYHQNQPGLNNIGAHIYYNTFRNMGTAMFRCSGSAPAFSQDGSADSNWYQQVQTNYQFDPACI